MAQIFYPATPGQAFVTNSYDSLSRIQTQTNILGGTWQFFLAGTRSEEVDPFGMRHVLYNTPRAQEFRGHNTYLEPASRGADHSAAETPFFVPALPPSRLRSRAPSPVWGDYSVLRTSGGLPEWQNTY